MDRIFSSDPLNATAGRVTARGMHWDPALTPPPQVRHHVSPPAVIPPEHYPGGKDFEDLRGRQFGRFTVIGFLGKRNPKASGLWLVRCACGAFEERKTKIVRAAAADQMCCSCSYLEYVKATARGPVKRAGSAG
ncbi:hypothetical protein [Croceicoccus sp. BE223]|uniref:hypothetical protein n=1 Tax=Croceicoccus sp. BE223 TaxID=2817716 RepID=UPI0028640865|nr:hypothetical protein [Croceicoccus sp. BE223]MDR7102975.1 hypothetical protein [Croceicoccus sp. BE223]